MSENVNPSTLKEGKLCRIQTNYLSIFPGDTIYGGGFRNLNSLGNFRAQLVITSCFDTQMYCLRQRSLEIEYSNISDLYLNRYKFDAEEDNSPSVSNNNINYNVVQSNTSRSTISLENNNFNIQISKCKRNYSLQSLDFSPTSTIS